MNRFSLVTNGLSYGNDPDGMLGKLAEVEFLLEGLAKETAVAMETTIRSNACSPSQARSIIC